MMLINKLRVLATQCVFSAGCSRTHKNSLPMIDFHIHANSISNIRPSAEPPLVLPYNNPANEQ